jgi:hypothetical protein
MFSLQEMTAWTPGEIEAAVHTALPPGWRFSFELVESFYWASYTDADEKVVWARENPDLRIVLLDAYGWLWARKNEASRPFWRPRHFETPPPKPGPMSHPGIPVPDPADLDPDEIAVVYRSGQTNRRN